MFTATPGMFQADTQGLALNVQDFGMNPSNTGAQNVTAFNNALASVSPGTPVALLFPLTGNGVYTVASPLIVDQDNVSLIGLGHRGGAPVIQTSSADPSFALIMGNTKDVNTCLIHGLHFIGLNSTSSTGGGIHFRCIGGKISQVRVAQFGGKGILVDASAGEEVYFEDVTLFKNGMNSTTPDDNLVIASTVGDSEFIRVISSGDSSKTTTRNGILAQGNSLKFFNCHAYFCSNDGMKATGSGIQIIGGEWESNAGYGIELNGATNFMVTSPSCFGNTNADIAPISCSFGSIVGGECTSAANKNIAPFGSNRITIADNICSNSSSHDNIQIDSTSSRIAVHDNVLTSPTNAINTAGQNGNVHDNLAITGNIIESAGANTNDIHDNTLLSGSITIVGAATKVRNNPGFNPQGAAAISVTASPFTYTAGPTPETVYITGGTVSSIAKNSVTLFTATEKSINLEPGESVVVTYSVAPTMNKDRH